jgi:hypothetical protein
VRELAFAARVYDAASPEGPRDYDGLYNQGLVLQVRALLFIGVWDFVLSEC